MRTIEKTIPTHLRIPKTLNAALIKAAKKKKTSKAEVMRHLLERGVTRL